MAQKPDYWARYLQKIQPCLFPNLPGQDLSSLPDGLRDDPRRCRGSIEIQLPGYQVLRAFCDDRGIELIHLFQLAWALVLRFFTGTNNVSFAYRESQEQCANGHGDAVSAIWDMCGICTADVSEDTVISDTLKAIHELAMRHRKYAAESSVDGLRYPAGLEGKRVFNTSLSFRDVEDVPASIPRAGHSGAEGIDVEIISIKKERLSGLLHYSYTVLSDDQGLHLVHAFVHSLAAIIGNPSSSVAELDLVSSYDREILSAWNHRMPERSDACVHHWIADRCAAQPDQLAISSCDGDVTYGELNILSSQLARVLASKGVGPGVIVPLCFEKSKWTIVSILGTIKAGGAFVLLDPSHPTNRLKQIIENVQGSLVASSPAQQDRMKALVPNVVTVSAEEKFWTECQADWSNAWTTPDNPVYVVFTSGSTGKAKGVLVDHAAFCTKAKAAGPALRLDTKPNVLQFTSYFFHVSYRDILTTLIWGGCLCVPSETERLNDLPGFMRRSAVTWASLTPSVIDLLKPSAVPDLKYLVVAGEQMPPRIPAIWASQVELMNAYGPCECVGISCLQRKMHERADCTNIGDGLTASLWLVEPHNANKLIPVGAIGEIVIESAAMGRGYINDKQKTKEAFVNEPLAWQSHFRPQRRLYKTGDLGRFNAHDGTLAFCGRKDSRVKLQGQLVELSEVEFHLHRCLADIGTKQDPIVAAAMININGTPMIIACIDVSSDVELTEQDCIFERVAPVWTLPTFWQELPERLAAVVPSFMIPFAFVPFMGLPLTMSGKKDRKLINDILTQLTVKDIRQYTGIGPENKYQCTHENGPPASPTEQKLQLLWADVLSQRTSDIGRTDSFFRLGGNSLASMKLVRLAQEQGVPLSVEMVFQCPTLASQAAAVMTANDAEAPYRHTNTGGEIGRFELITGGSDVIEDVICAVMEQCRLQREDIEDIYPCTPMQEGLIAKSAHVPGANLMQHIFEIQPDVDDRKLMQAWNTTVANNSLLRTKIAQNGNGETFQVVTIHSGIEWNHHNSLNEYLSEDRHQVMGLGDPLFRLAFITTIDAFQRPRYLVTTLHHAIFDAWSKSLLLKHMDAAYHLSPINPLSFKPFVKFVTDSQPSAQKYWHQELEGFLGPQFPVLPCSSHVPVASSKKRLTVSHLHTRGSDFTTSTWIQLAWALTLYHYTSSTDVVFGTTLTGRGVPVPRLDELAGPTLTTIPLRIALEPDATIKNTLNSLQKRSCARIPHEHLGLQHIRRVSDAAELACHFQNLLVLQTGETATRPSRLLREIEGPMENSPAASSSPLVLLVNPSGNETIDIEAVFDDKVIEPVQVERVLDHFGATLTWITQNEYAKVSAIPTISPNGMLEVYRRNASSSQSKEYCIHDLVRQNAQITPNSPALKSWDGDMSYRDLNDLSSRLARFLRDLGAGREIRIAIYIERSKWVVVTALAVLQTGATVLILEPSYPMSRLAAMCVEAGVTFILASPSNMHEAHNFGCSRVIAVGEGYADKWPAEMDPSVPTESNQICRPDDTAFIIFTSGSTGKPKGILLEHRNLASAVLLTRDTFQLTSRSRMFHLAAYAFDVSIYEIFAPLVVGGCVCIPTETMRKSAPAVAMDLLEANFVSMTPTVSRILEPSSIPTIETILLGGEPTTQEDIRRWGSSVRLFSGYGSAECCVISAARRIHDESDNNSIGGGQLSTMWIVSPSDHNQLAPIGAVGEVVIEGPNVARGYLNDPVKTKDCFISPPRWLTGLRGDTNTRLYKSGDLAQYTTQGAIRYIGRKDNQTKLNGQRLELEEIEEHARRYLLMTGDGRSPDDILASIVQPPHNGRPVLLVFIQSQEDSEQNEIYQNIFRRISDSFHRRTSGAQSYMSNQLPSYMIPAAFVPVSGFPTTTSGKKDLKELQRSISHLSETEWQRITGFARAELRVPATVTEARILEIARQVLGDTDVNVDDNFFRVGGDSVVAMRLVALAQENNMDLTVADMYVAPVLSEVARVIDGRINKATTAQSLQHNQLNQFSLLNNSCRATAILTAQKLCSVEIDEIEDIYPCTPLQEGMLALTLAGSSQASGKYVSSFTYRLPNSFSMERLKDAWEVVLQNTPILRTRIIAVGNQTLQVVIRGERALRESALHVSCPDKLLQEKIELGNPLVQTRVIEDEQDTGKRLQLSITMHHAVYDAWTVPLVLRQFQRAYDTGACDESPPLGPFVNYLLQTSGVDSENFWKEDLAGLEISHFPHIPSTSYEAVQHNTVSHHLPLPRCRELDTTLATAIQLAWGITISQYTNSWDVVFGLVISGRDVPVRGITSMPGPTISTVPLRLCMHPDSAVVDTLSAIQDRTAQRLPFAHHGLQNISQISEDCNVACKFQNLLVIQSGSQSDNSYLFSTPIRNQRKNRPAFDGHALTLTCEPADDHDAMHIKAFYDPGIISQSQMVLIIDQFSYIIRQVLSQPSKALSQVANLSPQHSQRINDWNSKVPEAVTSCLHDLVSLQWTKTPHQLAVSAWNGDFSYSELERLSRNFALELQSRYSVGPGVYVPVLTQKSKWAIVAILAIIRAGAAFVLLPTPQPPERLCKLVQIVDAKFLVTTSADDGMVPDLDVGLIALNDNTQHQYRGTPKSPLESKALPSDPVYIIFTSGSTGKPKGIVIHHAAFCTNALIAGPKIHYSNSSRVLQFSSYAFDASISEIFYTLVHGGCILIPKESEMHDNLSGVVTAYRANRIGMTPSLLRSIEPTDLPWVENLCLSGEAPQGAEIDKWAQHVNLINAYGPAECAVDTASKVKLNPGDEPNNIGRGLAAVCWVVVEGDLERLAPIGSIGELLVEGPTVGKGYLKDPERTAQSFVQAPMWLKQLRNVPYIQCYRTGDLVKYSPRGDGSLLFVGRKDNQIKLRGQRIELGEVEFHIRSLWDTAQDVVVDAITPAKSKDQALTAFILVPPNLRSGDRQNHSSQHDCDGCILSENTESFAIQALEVKRNLRGRLPHFMVPTLFLPLRRLPLNTSGKIDRRALKQTASALPRHVIQSYQCYQREKEPPRGSTELVLQHLMATLFNLPTDEFGMNDNFFHLGGDSIAAMRLCGLARAKGLSLSVADVFKHPQLQALAATIRESSESEITPVKPFSLIDTNSNEVVNFAAKQCGVGEGSISDVYPCTPMQEALMALSLKQKGAYVAHVVLKLGDHVDMEAFRRAWYAVTEANPILRTRIIQEPYLGALQVVVEDSFCWEWISESDEPAPREMGLGCPLIQLVSTRNLDLGHPNRVFLTIHHGLYDERTLSSIMDQVHAAYHDQNFHAYPFNHFVQHLAHADHALEEKYWRLQFQDFNAVPFPSLPSAQYLPRTTQTLNHTFSIHPTSGITAATVLKLAWAITIFHYTSSPDVVFGSTVSGRDVPLPGIDHTIGPTITTVPFPVQLQLDSTVEDALRKIQDQSINMIPFAHYGLQNIRRLNAETQVACLFQSLLVIHPRREINPHDDWIILAEDERAENFYGTHAVVLLCHLSDDAVHVQVQHDSNVVKSDEIQHIVAQFSHIISVLCEDPPCLINDIDRVGPQGVMQLQQWAGPPPQRVDDCVHWSIERICLKQPEAPAVCAWDGDLTYSQLDGLSTQLAACLCQLGIGPEVVVPVCLEKSRWTVVCMVAILKAGGAFLLLDTSQPIDRLQKICATVKSRIILSSQKWVPYSPRLAPVVISVSNEELDWQTAMNSGQQAEQVQPTNSLYAVFTSGSTGAPKGIMIDHSAFCSLAAPILSSFGLTCRSRILQFSSYAFDISILETLLALLSGGCICIPSNNERRDGLSTAAARMKANTAAFTPSVARTLHPTEFPTIDTLWVGGETPQLYDLQEWIQHAHVMSSYGPAECCPVFTAGPKLTLDSDLRNIGRPLAGDCWIVDPSDCNQLVSIGAVGELVLSGPTVGRGYINNPEATETAFISNPPSWLTKFRAVSGEMRLYKTGDLVQYSSDGSLCFIGRKDTQVKVRGQRVELGEIETAINEALPETLGVAVELVKGPSTGENGSLVAFIALGDSQGESVHHRNCASNSTFIVPTRDMQTMLSQLNQNLSKHIPSYMIPTRYLVLHELPVTRSHKIDRQLLRGHALALSSEELDLYSSVGSPKRRLPFNDREAMVRQICASVLHRTADSIGMDSSFFDIGGDSIVALRLVHEARNNGVNFTVSDIFTYPRLSDLAAVSARNSTPKGSGIFKQEGKLDPYLLIEDPDNLSNALVELGLPTDAVHLILPVTNGQVMRLHEQFHHFTFDLSGPLDYDQLEIACRTLIKRHEILRTVFHRINGTLCQIILQDLDLPLACRETSNLDTQVDDICHEYNVPPPALATPITKFTLVRESPDRHTLIMRLSHAQYDGVSIELLVQELKSLYVGQVLSDSTAFSDHIHVFMHQRRSPDARSFWRARLEGSSISYLGHRGRGQDTTMCQEEHQITATNRTVTSPSVQGITTATIVNAAWSLVLSQRTHRLDVLFGIATNGRNGYSSQGGNLIGLCMNQMPMRVTLDHSETVQSLLETIQRQYIQAMPFELVELSDIAQMCDLSHPPGDKVGFGSVIVVQNANVNTAAPFSFGDAKCIRGHVGTAPRRPYVMVEVIPSESGLSVHLYAPANIITQTDAQSIVAALCNSISLLAASLDKPLGKVFELPLPN